MYAQQAFDCAAENAHQMQLGKLFGVSAGAIRVDGKRVMERVRTERDRFVSGVINSVEKFPEAHRLRGHARFVGPNHLVVGNNLEVQAGRIIIATGSRPNIPGFLKEAKDRLVVNDDIFEWQDLPDSVAVFGPGVIGLELGQALSRLGVRVRMFGVGGAVGPIQDDSIRDYALKTFNEEFPLDPDSEVKNVERVDNGVAITFVDGDGGEKTETFDYLLAGTGRRPNVDGLDIQNAGIELDDKGLPCLIPIPCDVATATYSSPVMPITACRCCMRRRRGPNRGRQRGVLPGCANRASPHPVGGGIHRSADCDRRPDHSAGGRAVSRLFRRGRGIVRGSGAQSGDWQKPGATEGLW